MIDHTRIEHVGNEEWSRRCTTCGVAFNYKSLLGSKSLGLCLGCLRVGVEYGIDNKAIRLFTNVTNIT